MAEQTIGEVHVNWLLSAAHAYLAQSMAAQAITLLELLNALQPDNRQALRMLVYAYLLAARYRRVLETAAVLERINPEDHEQTAYLELLRSRALWGLGKTTASKEAFEKYIRLLATLNIHPLK